MSASSNRLQLCVVREDVLGVTPDTPRMRKMRITGEGLVYSPTYVDSEEIRDDRMLGDPIEVMKAASGPVNFETSYPEDGTPLSEIFRSALFNPWVNTPQFFNDGTADSVITDAGTTADTYAVVSGGAAVVAGHLVKASGFGNAANNQVFPAVAGSATTVKGASLSLTAETAPPGTAKLKVVGFQGASGDISALADGLASTTLDFTTLGLTVGRWLKIGGTLDASQFAFLVTAGAKARKGAWGRIIAISAHKITMDNLPAGWTTDTGTGKTIRVWFGDTIKNGTTFTSLTIERGFLGQNVPSYIRGRGLAVNTLTQEITSGDKIKGVATFTGMGGDADTVPLDASPDPVTTNPVMAANQNVGRLGVNGQALASPNWCKAFTMQIDNNLTALDAVDSDSPVDLDAGENKVTGKVTTYFGSLDEVNAFYNGTPRSINARIDKNGQALIYQIPRAIYRDGGNPNASAKNTQVMADFGWQASVDPLTNAQIIVDRLPYFES
jgi:hypothetical protein